MDATKSKCKTGASFSIERILEPRRRASTPVVESSSFSPPAFKAASSNHSETDFYYSHNAAHTPPAPSMASSLAGNGSKLLSPTALRYSDAHAQHAFYSSAAASAAAASLFYQQVLNLQKSSTAATLFMPQFQNAVATSSAAAQYCEQFPAAAAAAYLEFQNHEGFSPAALYCNYPGGFYVSAAGVKRKGGQIRFTNAQTKNLETRFSSSKYLSPEERRHLALQLKLSDRQVKTWFQNRRAKWRRANQQLKRAAMPPAVNTTSASTSAAMPGGARSSTGITINSNSDADEDEKRAQQEADDDDEDCMVESD